MKLLVEPEYLPPSADYLYARIGCRGQRMRIEMNVAAQLQSSQRQLRKEYRWIYFRLESRVRRLLLPVFEVSELQLLVLALRYLAAGELRTLAELLQQSLLPPQVQRKVLATRSVLAAITVLERLLGVDCAVFHGATEAYLRQGPGGLEQRLLGGYLPQALAVSRPAPVRALLVYLLDMRNLLSLYKHLHWQLPLPPALLDGGEIPLAACERCWQRQDLHELRQLVQKRSGINADPEVVGFAELLEQGLTSRLRRQAREPLQIGVLLDYLWCCRLLARTPARPMGERELVEVDA